MGLRRWGARSQKAKATMELTTKQAMYGSGTTLLTQKNGVDRGLRGGSWGDTDPQSNFEDDNYPTATGTTVGFRVAFEITPEPSSGILLIVSLILFSLSLLKASFF